MGLNDRVFGGHACRVAGATFLASRGIPMAVIQLLGRWSSGHRTVHPVGAVDAASVGADACPVGARHARRAGGRGHSWLSRSPWPTRRPMRVSRARGPAHSWLPRPHPRKPRQRRRDQRPGSPGYSSYRRSDRSGRSRKRTGGPEHFIYLARTRRVHKPRPRRGQCRTGRLGAQWAAAGRTAGDSSSGCRLRRPAQRSAVAASLAGLEGCSEAVERFVGLRPLGLQGLPLRLTGPRRPSESGGSTPES